MFRSIVSAFNACKLFFQSLFRFLKNEKALFPFLMLFLDFLLLQSSALVISSSLSANKPITLAEISYQYKNENGEYPYGLIYSYQLNQSYSEIVFHDPEKSKEVRNIFYKESCFDLYPANWENNTSPALIEDEDGNEKKISLLLWPKHHYTRREFAYKIPLLSGLVEDFTSPNDIYVSKEYADILIAKNGILPGEYDELILNYSEITIPYCIKNGSQDKKVPVFYDIKGVFDSSSEEYLYYYGIFGEFFLVNEFFSLAIPSVTFFTMTSEVYPNWKYLDVLNNIYSYETIRKSSDSITSFPSCEYRMAFFGDLKSNYPFSSLSDGSSKYWSQPAKMYEFYSSKYDVSYIAIFGLLNLILFTFLFILGKILIAKVFHYFDKEHLKQGLLQLSLFSIILVIISFFLGIYGLMLFRLIIPPLASVIGMNYWSVVIFLVEFIVITVFSVLKIRRLIKSHE